MDHLGIELASTDLVSAATDGLAEAGLSRARNREPPAATPRRTRSGGDRTGEEPREVYTVKADARPHLEGKTDLGLSSVAGDGSCCVSDTAAEDRVACC
jgi:hypothetical protein